MSSVKNFQLFLSVIRYCFCYLIGRLQKSLNKGPDCSYENRQDKIGSIYFRKKYADFGMRCVFVAEIVIIFQLSLALKYTFFSDHMLQKHIVHFNVLKAALRKFQFLNIRLMECHHKNFRAQASSFLFFFLIIKSCKLRKISFVLRNH